MRGQFVITLGSDAVGITFAKSGERRFVILFSDIPEKTEGEVQILLHLIARLIASRQLIDAFEFTSDGFPVKNVYLRWQRSQLSRVKE